MINILIILLFSLNVNASLNEVDKTQIYNKNLLVNGGFENGKAKWTASAGTFAVTGTTPMVGLYHATWDAAASGNTLTTTAAQIPAGMYGRNGVATCLITTASGTATHSLQAYDGSNILATVAITSSTTPTRASVNFVMPTSGSISLRLYANADEPNLSGIDDCYLGPAEGYNLGLGQGQDVFSANISAAGVVSQENIDFINGNCVVTGTAVFTCTLSLTLQNKLNCIGALERAGAGTGHAFYDNTNSSSTSAIFRTNDNSGTLAAASFQVSCQRQGTDAPVTAFKPDTVANSWSGYHDNTCSWARANTAYGDPTADASCALVERTNSNFGTVTTSGSSLPGIVFTPKRAGKYYVCATPEVSLNNISTAIRLWDGTTTITENASSYSSGSFVNSSLCGQYVATSTSAVTLSLQTKSASGTVTIATSITASAVEWSIFQIDQALPAPLLVNSVVNPSAGVTNIVSAQLTSVTTTAVVQQDGSWISSLVDNGTGDTTINIASGTFSATPNCVCTGVNASIAQVCQMDPTTTFSSTLVRVQTGNDSGTATDIIFNIICVGPK